MGIVEEIKTHGEGFRASDAALRAEALRELESGEKREGLWSLSLIEADMDDIRARDAYIRLRVRSLKDLMALSASAAREKARISHRKVAHVASDLPPVDVPIHPGCGGLLNRCIKGNYVSWTCGKCSETGSLVRGAPYTAMLRKKREEDQAGKKYWESRLYEASGQCP